MASSSSGQSPPQGDPGKTAKPNSFPAAEQKERARLMEELDDRERYVAVAAEKRARGAPYMPLPTLKLSYLKMAVKYKDVMERHLKINKDAMKLFDPLPVVEPKQKVHSVLDEALSLLEGISLDSNPKKAPTEGIELSVCSKTATQGTDESASLHEQLAEALAASKQAESEVSRLKALVQDDKVKQDEVVEQLKAERDENHKLKAEVEALKSSFAKNKALWDPDKKLSAQNLQAATKNATQLRAELGNAFMLKTADAIGQMQAVHKLSEELSVRESKLQPREDELNEHELAVKQLKSQLASESRFDFDAEKLRLRKSVESDQITSALEKMEKAQTQLRERTVAFKDQEAFMEKMFRLLKSLRFDDNGAIVQCLAQFPEPKQAPTIQGFTDAQAAQIYREGKVMGYHEYAKDYEIRYAMSSNSHSIPDFEESDQRYQYLKDSSDARHPFRRGEEAGYMMVASVFATAAKSQELDGRVWKKPVLTKQAVNRLSASTVEGSYWAGFDKGGQKWLDEHKAQIQSVQEKLKAKSSAA